LREAPHLRGREGDPLLVVIRSARAGAHRRCRSVAFSRARGHELTSWPWFVADSATGRRPWRAPRRCKPATVLTRRPGWRWHRSSRATYCVDPNSATVAS